MKSSNIGGQAVLEGIMMKNGPKYAVAVRKPDGEITEGGKMWRKPNECPIIVIDNKHWRARP